MTDVRAAALDCLIRILEKGELSHLVLKETLEACKDWEKRDRAFLTRLTEGTIERLYELDYIIDRFSRVKTEKQKPVIREILRMAVYQLKYMDSVPERAAVNEAVRLCGKRGFGSLKGFVNGVLRTIARELPGISYPKREEGFAEWARVAFSMPAWITETLMAEYGEARTEAIFRAMVPERPLTVRFYTSRASEKEILESLSAQEITAVPAAEVPGTYVLEHYDSLDKIRAFTQGLFQVQDVSSVLSGLAASPKPGDFVLDVCAAPGGKSLLAADLLAGTGHVEARDLKPDKVALIEENIRRSGLSNISARVFDAMAPDRDMIGKADVVIADLPCSGLGIIGRKSDIKYKLTEEGQKELVRIQRAILSVVWQYVKPGGRLVFSTCTLLPSENRENADWFAAEYPFFPEPLSGRIPERFLGDGPAHELQLLPGEKGTDGFFISSFRRKAEEGDTYEGRY